MSRLPSFFSTRLISYSGESPTDGRVDGYAASSETRSSKNLLAHELQKQSSDSLEDLPYASDMSIALKDRDLDPSLAQMDGRCYAAHTSTYHSHGFYVQPLL